MAAHLFKMKYIRFLFVLLFLTGFYISMNTISAVDNSTIYVNGSGGNDSWDGQNSVWNGTSGPKKTIKNATDAVNPDGTINIANGYYNGTENTGLSISKNMKIIGESQSGAIIDGNNQSQIFKIASSINVILQKLTLKNGYSSNGGAIYNEGTCTVKDCTIYNNTAQSNGGGIYNNYDIKVTDSAIMQNTANDGGGISNYGSLSVTNCFIQNNTAQSNGGGIYNNRYINVIDSVIQENNATCGGGIYSTNTCKVITSTIQKNSAKYCGGGIYNTNKLSIVISTISGNTPEDIYGNSDPYPFIINKRTLTMYTVIQTAIDYAQKDDTILVKGTYQEHIKITKNLQLVGDQAIIDGSKNGRVITIQTGIIATITGFTIKNGYAGNGANGANGIDWFGSEAGGSGGSGSSGGAIYSTGTLTLNNCTITNNSAGNGGNGGNGGGTVLIDGGPGGAGGAGGNGGAIYSTGTLTLNNCTITNNSAGNGGNGGNGYYSLYLGGGDGGAGGAGGNGGAIYSTGTLTLNNCTITNNSAGNGGNGGIGAYGLFKLGAGGYGGNGGCGGGIYSTGTLNLINTILTNNKANIGGNGGNGGHSMFGDGHKGSVGDGGSGGAINNQGNMTATNCTFNNNTATYGGAVYNNGTLNVLGCIFNCNNVTALDKDGNPLEIRYYNPANTLDGWNLAKSIISTVGELSGSVGYMLELNFFNVASDWCSATNSVLDIIQICDKAFATEVTINKIKASGGAIDSARGNININGCFFNNNTASLGGAINNLGNGTCNVVGSNFKDNKAFDGGGLFIGNKVVLTVANCTFTNNCALDGGGAIIYAGGTGQTWGFLNVTGNVFKENYAYLGGAVYIGVNGTSQSYINFNSIYGTGHYDIYDQYPDNTADATLNWWGSNSGPQTYNVKKYSNIDTEPYMILIVTANPNTPAIPKSVQYNQSTAITADILHDNTYLNGNYPASSYHDPQYGVVPDGIQVIFTTTGGTIIPASATMINGITKTTYTANGIIGTSNLVKVYASADNVRKDTVLTLINVTPIPTEILINPVFGNPNQTVPITVNVIDSDGNPITTGNVTFTIGTTKLKGILNSEGKFTCNYTIPDWKPGAYFVIDVAYSGTNIYASSVKNNAILKVGPESNLYLEVIPGSTNSMVGNTVLYILKVGNKGPGTGRNVVMTCDVPEGLEFVRANVDAGTYTYDPSTRIITWNIGNIPMGDHYMWLSLRILREGDYQIDPTLSTDSYNPELNKSVNSLSINAVSQVKTASRTVEMQDTGIPILPFALGIICVLTGFATTRRK